MSIREICGLLEVRLAAMAGALPAADENIGFEPGAAPYWRISHIPNQPIERAVTLDCTEWQGLLQVTLSFPLNEGRGNAQSVADLIAQHFAPPLTLTGTTLKVSVAAPVYAAAGRPEGGRWELPVTVSWSAFRI